MQQLSVAKFEALFSMYSCALISVLYPQLSHALCLFYLQDTFILLVLQCEIYFPAKFVYKYD
jgi:hypothetical protein